MRTPLVWVLALAVAVLFGAAVVRAEKSGDAPSSGKPAESSKTDKPDAKDEKAEPTKPAEDGADAKPDDDAKADDDEAATKAPPKRLSPMEKKMALAAELHVKVKKAQEKIPAVETKINKKIGKLTDGARQPVEPRTLQRELEDKNPSMAARAFKKLTLQLVAVHEKIKSGLMGVLKQYRDVARTRRIDEDLKTKAQAETAAVKEECIEVLSKLASLYERVAMAKKVTSCYKQILALDKTNSAAKTYFKELKEKKKAASSGGSGAHSGTGSHGGARR
jgi:hypothetical protein